MLIQVRSCAGLRGAGELEASTSPDNPRDFRKALSFSAGSESKRGAGSNRKNNSVSQGHRYFSGAQIIARQGLQGKSIVGPSGVAESPKSRTVPFSKGGLEGRGGRKGLTKGTLFLAVLGHPELSLFFWVARELGTLARYRAPSTLSPSISGNPVGYLRTLRPYFSRSTCL